MKTTNFLIFALLSIGSLHAMEIPRIPQKRQKELDELLLNAVERETVAQVKDLVRRGANVNYIPLRLDEVFSLWGARKFKESYGLH